MSKRIVIVIAAALLWTSVAHAEMPERVRAMCGDGPVPWESLCNVDPGLHDAFLTIEGVGGGPDFTARNRLSAMIRDRHAAIDWHPNSALNDIHPGLLGMYDASTGRVYVPQPARGEPLRVKAAILAHELAHAGWEIDNFGEGLDPRDACLRNEAFAFRIGLIIYALAFVKTDEGPQPRSAVDAMLYGQVQQWWDGSGRQGFTPEALQPVIQQHLERNGYFAKCAARSAPHGAEPAEPEAPAEGEPEAPEEGEPGDPGEGG